MKKKGFTLIEILAVIVLLGTIALIVTPTVKNVIKDSKQKLYDEQINLIKDGLKNWANANVFLLPEENQTMKLSLGQLKQDGFAEIKINNPKNNKCFSNDSVLNITKYNNSYIYEIEEIKDVDCDLIDDTPTVKLNGSVIEYLTIGDIYLEKGVVAKDSNGNDITDSVVTTVTGSGNEVNTKKSGNYTITYSITQNGKIMTTIRNLIVKNFENGILDSSDNCINIGTCKKGTIVNAKVNDIEKYSFYVLNDDGKTLTLIMNKNLGKTVAWVNETDYDGTDFGTKGNNSKGPLTALAYLNTQTANWTNIEPVALYSYINNLNGTQKSYGYQKLDIVYGVTTVTAKDATTRTIPGVSRARLLTSEEAKSEEIGCTSTEYSCVEWLYSNLPGSTANSSKGYWLLSAATGTGVYAPSMRQDGKVISAFYVYETKYFGVRPIIEVSK